MMHPIPAWSRRNLAAMVFAALVVTVGACSGSGTTTSSIQALPKGPGHGTSTPTPSPTWTFLTVDNTAGGNNSRVTGLDDASPAPHLVGLNGTTHTDYSSWTAPSPYNSFNPGDNYPSPNSNGTYISSIADSNTNFEAGTVFSPPPNSKLNCTTCGITYYADGSGTSYGGTPPPSGCGNTNNPCKWTFIQDPNEGTGSCAVTEALGLGDSKIAVGYYETASCGLQAFEAYYFPSTGEKFVDFSVPGAASNSTEATGINGLGDVTGFATFGSTTAGWFYSDGLYCTGLMVPNSAYTYPTSINWSDDIAGYYQDKSDSHVHGFLLYKVTSPSNLVWVNPIDDPNANHIYTVVSGVNTHRALTGWYKDTGSATHLHGFVATCLSDCGTSPSERERRLGIKHSISAFIATRRRPSTAPQPTCTQSPSMKRRKAL